MPWSREKGTALWDRARQGHRPCKGTLAAGVGVWGAGQGGSGAGGSLWAPAPRSLQPLACGHSTRGPPALRAGDSA